VLIEEALDGILIQSGYGKPVTAHPSRKVRNAAQILPCRPGRVVLLDEGTPVGWNKWGKSTIVQPCGRHGVDQSKRIHDGSPDVRGCHHREPSLLCEVQNRLPSSGSSITKAEARHAAADFT
jgi:hypothetical protein